MVAAADVGHPRRLAAALLRELTAVCVHGIIVGEPEVRGPRFVVGPSLVPHWQKESLQGYPCAAVDRKTIERTASRSERRPYFVADTCDRAGEPVKRRAAEAAMRWSDAVAASGSVRIVNGLEGMPSMRSGRARPRTTLEVEQTIRDH